MIRSLFLLLMIAVSFCTIGQKRFSEGTIEFKIVTTIDGSKTLPASRAVQSVKAAHYRNELISDLGRMTTIYDTRDEAGAILREYGAQKIMTPITRENWNEIMGAFAEAKFEITQEQKVILGFSSTKAIAAMKDGSVLEVFFTTDLVNDNPELYLQFKNLPGMALAYTVSKGKTTVCYSAVSISFDPVAIQKFEIPTVGYRVLGFKESKIRE